MEKFIADAMLGKLAKWMRIIGYDVEYSRDIPDEDLVDRAHAEGRIILTRDTLLIRRRRAKAVSFFVKGDSYKDQLRQVVDRFPPGEKVLVRCIRCNLPLVPVEKHSIRGVVPLYVYQTQERFEACTSCRRVYWKATHPELMRRHMKEMGII